ncbi:IS110 family insertion sequence transposase domain-containing protein (plasmid) [Rhizobium etli 8C-3]|uniref:IS110 family insertion sequence transposase domain-containing protein n=1 Tax=Rhizobium etli 8C-3 TaxID=538025 RepID=A0A1L5PAJ0_RHIET|nr:IS110 family insertion sequence transposase domain-containing protein [Rhizobium etli 8C-3]
MGYLGLVPGERSTGETVRRGAITKADNGRVRHMLVESAWTYRHPPRVGTRKLYPMERGSIESSRDRMEGSESTDSSLSHVGWTGETRDFRHRRSSQPSLRPHKEGGRRVLLRHVAAPSLRGPFRHWRRRTNPRSILIVEVSFDADDITAVDLGLLHLLIKRMRRAADLGGDRGNSSPRDGYSASCSVIIRTARTSGGEFVRRLASHRPSFSRVGSPAIPERFRSAYAQEMQKPPQLGASFTRRAIEV